MCVQIFEIAARRRKLKIQHMEITRELGISPASLSDIERGYVEVSDDYLRRFSEALDKLSIQAYVAVGTDRTHCFLSRPGADKETLSGIKPQVISITGRRKFLRITQVIFAHEISLHVSTVKDIECGRIEISDEAAQKMFDCLDRIEKSKEIAEKKRIARPLGSTESSEIHRLVLRRKALGIHQIEVCRALNISLPTLTDIEICRVGVSMAFLDRYSGVIDKLSLLSEHVKCPVRRKAISPLKIEAPSQVVIDLIRLRKKRGIGQLSLAFALNINPTTIAEFESGYVDFSQSTIVRMTKAIETFEFPGEG